MTSRNNASELNHRSACPIARSLDLFGDRWSLLVMRDALFFGQRTYADFARSGEKIPTNLLADRLKKLTALQLLEKVPYQERPTRYEYVPTEKGKALKPVLKAMRQYGESYLGGKVPGS